MPVTTRALTIHTLNILDTPQAGAVVRLQLTKGDLDVDGTVLSTQVVDVVTDETGTAVAHLWPNALGQRDSRYTVTILSPDGARVLFRGRFFMPDADSLLDILLVLDNVRLSDQAVFTNQVAAMLAGSGGGVRRDWDLTKSYPLPHTVSLLDMQAAGLPADGLLTRAFGDQAGTYVSDGNLVAPSGFNVYAANFLAPVDVTTGKKAYELQLTCPVITGSHGGLVGVAAQLLDGVGGLINVAAISNDDGTQSTEISIGGSYTSFPGAPPSVVTVQLDATGAGTFIIKFDGVMQTFASSSYAKMIAATIMSASENDSNKDSGKTFGIGFVTDPALWLHVDAGYSSIVAGSAVTIPVSANNGGTLYVTPVSGTYNGHPYNVGDGAVVVDKTLGTVLPTGATSAQVVAEAAARTAADAAHVAAADPHGDRAWAAVQMAALADESLVNAIIFG